MSKIKDSAIRAKPWGYLDGVKPLADAPLSDNPSGLYCPDCRGCGMAHCASPEYCGGMRPMRARVAVAKETGV